MLKKVINKRKAISSLFYCVKEKDFDKGVYADLFILCELKKADLQIQLWQIIDQGDEMLFAHGYINIDTLKFNHFDLASHFVDPTMIPKLINDKQRPKLLNKVKWIRIDGQLDEKNVFEMIKMFFPHDHLIEEFIENPVPNNV